MDSNKLSLARSRFARDSNNHSNDNGALIKRFRYQGAVQFVYCAESYKPLLL